MKLACHKHCKITACYVCNFFLKLNRLPTARATLEILIPDFVKQTSEEKPKDSEELEV